MGDFNNAGDANVGGDLNVLDSSIVEHKLLVQCTTAELLKERPFRLENIRLESKRKFRRLFPIMVISVLLVITAAIWAQVSGNGNLVILILGAGSLFVGATSIRAQIEPNHFQRQEQAAVNEIDLILKSRRTAPDNGPIMAIRAHNGVRPT